jgi:hypothetical protein
VGRIGQRIAGRCLDQLGDCANISGADLGRGYLLLAAQNVELADALILVLLHVPDM